MNNINEYNAYPVPLANRDIDLYYNGFPARQYGHYIINFHLITNSR